MSRSIKRISGSVINSLHVGDEREQQERGGERQRRRHQEPAVEVKITGVTRQDGGYSSLGRLRR